MGWTAEEIYGVAGAMPGSAGATTAAAPAPHSSGGIFSEPALWIVALLAIALGLIHVAFRVEV